jgi:YD repeat-containing protein
MKKRGLLFYIILFINILKVYSQEGSSFVGVFNQVEIPPSPNASSLGRYGEIPVSKSTGIPSINIPLFEIKDRGIIVPISISYHAGGIRVADEASWVGLGWSLNAGGAITRVVRGKPDEKGWFSNGVTVPTNTTVANMNIRSNEQTYSFLNLVSNGNWDYEPDLFYYNFGELSGSFFIGNDGYPVLFPFQNIKISYSYTFNEGLKSFSVVDEKGINYSFSTKEISITQEDLFVSGWYLDEIYNPFTGTKINFEYEVSQHISSSVSSMAVWETQPMGSIISLTPETPDYHSTTINGQFLNKIVSSNSELVFFTSASDDGLGKRKLDSIQYVDKLSEEKLKSYLFNYSYFNPNSNSYDEKRLKLNYLELTNQKDNNRSRHSFYYSTIELPEKTSKSVDHWGFYNGKGNTSYLPLIKSFDTQFGSANREPDSNYSKAGMLRMIIYPTGGFTEFNFESNAYSRPINKQDISLYGQTDGLLANGCENCQDYEVMELNNFFPKNRKYYNIMLNATLTPPPGYSEHMNEGLSGEVLITNSAGEILISGTMAQSQLSFEAELPDGLFDDSTILLLKIHAIGTSAVVASANLSYYSYNPDSIGVLKEFLAGGQRIKEIKNFDQSNKLINRKSYDYNKSGYLTGGIPDYMSIFTSSRPIDNDPNFLLDYKQIMLYSSPPGGLGSSQNSVSYKEVSEYLGTATINSGKTTTKYYEIEDNNVGGPPFMPKISYQCFRNYPITETYYENKGNESYQAIKQIEFKYSKNNSKSTTVKGFKAAKKRQETSQTPFYNIWDYNFGNFILFADFYTLDEKITKDKFEGKEVITSERYYYNNVLHPYANVIETIEPDGNVRRVELKYPEDFTKTMYGDCKQNLEAQIEECEDQHDLCYEEHINCQGKYFPCREKYNKCEVSKRGYQNLMCKFPWGGWDLHCLHITDRYFPCTNLLEACLDSAGYYSCLENLGGDCGYSGCNVEAIQTSHECWDNYNSAILNSINSSSGSSDVGPYLLTLYNNVSQPIEKTVFNNDKKIEHIVWNYGFHESLVDSVPVLKSISKEYGTYGQVEEVKVDKYNESRNIIQTSNIQNCPQSYIWGYENQYPVLKIESCEPNIPVAQIQTIINGLTLSGSESKVSIDADIVKLKNSFAAYQGDEYMFAIYTYKPLVGVTSETDTRGRTTYYLYDGFGRLKEVRDHEYNIIKQYEYHYAGQEQ